MPARIGFLEFQTPIRADEIIPIMIANGVRPCDIMDRLADRFCRDTIRKYLAQDRGDKNDAAALRRENAEAAARAATVIAGAQRKPVVRRLSPRKPAKVDPLLYANVYHLIDLKRAGHSPTRTEFRIPSDDSGLRRMSFPAALSFMGSPSALAAEA